MAVRYIEPELTKAEQTRGQLFARYRENLYIEDPQAWLELEKFILTLRVRLAMDEAAAQELACLVICGPCRGATAGSKQAKNKQRLSYAMQS